MTFGPSSPGHTGFTPEHTGFTSDISVSGLFLCSRHMYRPGTLLFLQIKGPEGEMLLVGRVVRTMRVPVTLRILGHQGMGIRFLGPGDLVPLLLRQPGAPPERVPTVDCNSAADLHFLLSEQVQQGICVVRCDAPPAPNAEIEFEIRLRFGCERTVRTRGRVVQILEMAGGKNAVVELQDSAALRGELEGSS